MKIFFKDKERQKKIIWEIIAIILIVFFAVSLSPKRLQNDTFYTVSIGKLILENGIDMQDHFSWHNLPYTYPHWLYDVMIYSIYNIGGWTGVYVSTCVFASILGVCIYFVNSRLSKNKITSFLVTIAVLYLIKSYIAARAQLVTFILFILLVYNIEKFLENKKIKYALALFAIQTLIANLHVAVWPFSFVLYLPYIAEYLLCELADFIFYNKAGIFINKLKIKIYKNKCKNKNNSTEKLEKLKNRINKVEEELEKIQARNIKIEAKRKENAENTYKIEMHKNKNTRWLILVMAITAITGLLTPLGKVPYTYTYLTMIGNTMKNINEHLPLTLADNIPIMCTLIVILAVLTFTKAKIKLSDLFMLGGLTYLMFATRRQQSMFVLIGSVAFTRIVTDFLKRSLYASVDQIDEKLINRFTVFVIIAIIIIWGIHYFKERKNEDFIDKKVYPVEASEWILNNLDVKNIKLFNEYNYGSYLLYKGIPVFIDSRCDLYAPEYNTPTGNSDDGEDIFSDFINSSGIGTYYGDIFKKYDITHVIVYKNSKIKMLIEKADSEKYKELYSDDNFVIYKVLEY